MSFGRRPSPPPMPVFTPPSQEEIKTEADKAAEEVKKRARKAGSGRQATILTSPLGVVSPVQPVIKTLLGS